MIYIPDYKCLNHPNITKLVFQKCTNLELTEYEKWVLFDFDYDEWFDHLEFIMGATREQLKEFVANEVVTDGDGNIITEENWKSSIMKS